MTQLAFAHETLEARLVTGKVIHIHSDSYRVLASHVACNASLAASCLLAPQERDTVLTALLEDGSSVILAVLFREEAPARLRLPENSTIECADSLTLRTGTTLALQSARDLRLQSQNLDVGAENASASVVNARTVCDTAEHCCRVLSSIGQRAVSVFHSVTQCLGESHRMVQGADETRCTSSTLLVDESATVMAKNSLNLTEETARTDAKLIQLG